MISCTRVGPERVGPRRVVQPRDVRPRRRCRPCEDHRGAARPSENGKTVAPGIDGENGRRRPLHVDLLGGGTVAEPAGNLDRLLETGLVRRFRGPTVDLFRNTGITRSFTRVSKASIRFSSRTPRCARRLRRASAPKSPGAMAVANNRRSPVSVPAGISLWMSNGRMARSAITASPPQNHAPSSLA